MQAKTDRIQASLDGVKARDSALDGQCTKLLTSKKGLTVQLLLRFEDSHEVEELMYLLDGAVANKCRSKSVI